MKYNFTDFGILKDCLLIDSVHILKDDGCQRPGLDTLCQELNIKRNIHSALEDPYILKKVFIKKPELLDYPYDFTFKDLNGKLPIPIQRELESILFEYVQYEPTL